MSVHEPRLKIVQRRGGLPLTGFEAPDPEVTVPPQSGAPVPWTGARVLLEELAAIAGVMAWDATPVRLRPACAVVLPEWRARLSAKEQEVSDGFACNCPAALTYPNFQTRPVVRALAETMARLIPKSGVTVRFPQLKGVDAETTWLLQPLLQSAGAKIRLVIGDDPEFVPDNAVARFTAEGTTRVLGVLRAMDGAVLEVDTELNNEPCPAVGSEETRLWDEAVTADFAELMALVRRSFAAFGTGFAYTLAMKLLERAPDAEESAELHAIAGLCVAQLLQLQNEPESGDEESDHYEAALAAKDGDARFPWLLCRLSVLESRKKKFERAAELLDRAWEVARGRSSAEYARYLQAWVLNGRALQMYRSRRKDEAVRLLEEALELIDSCVESAETPRLHLVLTHYFLCQNATRVHFMAGDTEEARIWFQRTREYAEQHVEWVDAPPSEYSVLLASDDVEARVWELENDAAVARTGLEPWQEAEASRLLGMLLFRHGRAQEAYGRFARTLEILDKMAGPEDLIAGAVLGTGFAALRSLRSEEALKCFDRLKSWLDEATLLELEAAELLARTQAGPRDQTEEARVAAALLSPGVDRGITLRGASYLGQAMGTEDGLAWINSVLDKTDWAEVFPGDALAVLVTALEMEPSNVAWKERALEVAPIAIQEDDANVWWDYQRLMRLPDAAPGGLAAASIA